MSNTETSPLQDFLNYLTFQKRYSPHTIISYQNDLTNFFDFILAEYKISKLNEITASIVRTWLASLKENKYSPKSINRKISSLKAFFKYQLRLKKITVSPVSTITSLKVNKRLPSFVAEKDIKILLEHDFFPETFAGKTDFLIIFTLMHTLVFPE